MFDFGRQSPVQQLLCRDPPLEEVLGFESVAETVDTLQEDVEPEFKQEVEAFVRKHSAALIDVATTEIDDVRAEEAPQLATTFPRNATSLLSRCFGEDKTLFKTVVERCIRALERRDLHPVAARNVARILEAAFVEDPLQVTAIVDNEVGDPQLVHSLIRHCSRSPAVGLLLLAILGNALGEPPELEDPNAYARPWQRVSFPLHLVAYIKVAMSDEDAEPYFTFMQALLQNSLAPHFGVIVDDILALEDGQSLVALVCEALEECTAAGSTESYPLLSEGLTLMVHILSTVRAVSMTPTSPEEYAADVSHRALRDIKARLPALVAGLSIGADRGTDDGRPLPLGVVRLRVIDVCIAVFGIARKGTDEALFDAGFFPQFLAVAAQHPSHDILMVNAVDVCLEAIARSYDDRALLRHLIEKAGLLDRLVEWSTSEGLQDTSLRAMALNVAHSLSKVPVAETITDNTRWERFAAGELLELTEHWFTAITGAGFEQPGTGCSHPVDHRDVKFLLEQHQSPLLAGVAAPGRSEGGQFYAAAAEEADDVDAIAGLEGINDDAISPDDILAGVDPIAPADVAAEQWEERDIIDASDALAAVGVGEEGSNGDHETSELGGTVGKGGRPAVPDKDSGSDEDW